jgi:hypothetical protein
LPIQAFYDTVQANEYSTSAEEIKSV